MAEVSAQRGRGPDTWRREAWSGLGDGVRLYGEPDPPRPMRLAAAPQAVTLDLARTALVVIDMQNDFCHPHGWFPAVRGVDPAPLLAPVPVINRLSRAFRAAGRPVVFVNWGVSGSALELPATALSRANACGTAPGYGAPSPRGEGRILVTGDWGQRLIEAIETDPADVHVAKVRLSGFWDSVLDSTLRRMGVTTLLYAGINTDRCVFATLMDGSFAGYEAVLVEDACATPSPAPIVSAVLELVRMLYGFTTTSAAVLDGLAAAAALHPDPETRP